MPRNAQGVFGSAHPESGLAEQLPVELLQLSVARRLQQAAVERHVRLEELGEQPDGRVGTVLRRAAGGGGTVDRQGIQAVTGDEIAPGRTLAVEETVPSLIIVDEARAPMRSARERYATVCGSPMRRSQRKWEVIPAQNVG